MTLEDTPLNPPTPLTESSPEPTPTPLPEPKRNLGQVALGVIIQPYKTFAWLREKGGLNWLIPLGLVLALTLLSRVVAVPIEQKAMADALAQFQQQIDQANANGGNTVKGGTFTFGPVGAANLGTSADQANPANDAFFSYGMPVIGALGTWFLMTLVMLILAWILGGRPSGGAIVRLSSWASVPVIVRLVVVTVTMLLTQRIPVQGLSRAFAPGDVVISGDTGGTSGTDSGGNGPKTLKPVIVTVGPNGATNFQGPTFGEVFTQNLLSAVDLYTVWQLVLLTIGLAAVAQISWWKSLIVTVSFWLISLAIATLPVLLGPALGGLLGGGGGPTFISR